VGFRRFWQSKRLEAAMAENCRSTSELLKNYKKVINLSTGRDSDRSRRQTVIVEFA